MELLRFIAAGNVDDGKSTLIGRLLYDSDSLQRDIRENIEKISQKNGTDFNLALLTDGLKAEREQGITIDVAYKYFHTPKRKFIIADCPGHVQYTRNMVTGASTADLMIVLVDARKGITEQTRRHAYIGSLLGIEHFVICINKMDLVDFSEEVYNKIQSEFQTFAKQLSMPDVKFIPVAALDGDNVVNGSTRMPFYKGTPLLHLLETVLPVKEIASMPMRFPVQLALLPPGQVDRLFAGQLASGSIKKGDTIEIAPGGKTKIKSILLMDQELQTAVAPQSIGIQIEDNIDVARGALMFAGDAPQTSDTITATICWMDSKPLKTGGKYHIKHTTNVMRCAVQTIEHKLEMQTLEKVQSGELNMNDIGKITIRCARPLTFDSYKNNRWTGSFILVDDANQTAGAGVIENG